MKLVEELRNIVRDSIRMYFAPLAWAIKAIRAKFFRPGGESEQIHTEQ